MVGTEHSIVGQVYAAKTDPEAADALIGQYMGFIRSETVKFIHAAPEDGIICFDEFVPLFTKRHEMRPVMNLGPSVDKAEQARHIFDALRSFDHTAVKAIWAQCPDVAGIGLAIANRLNKAAGFHIIEV